MVLRVVQLLVGLQFSSSYSNQTQTWKVKREPLLVYAKGNYFYPKKYKEEHWLCY